MADKKTKTYFTARLPYWVGLSDQLCHLIKLYLIGRALNYTYVHTPLSFPRSYNKSLSEKVLDYVSRFTSRRRKKKRHSADGLSKFCGLDQNDLNINDSQFASYNKINVNIDTFFSGDGPYDINSLQLFIASLGPFPGPVIFSLNTAGIYLFNSKIDTLLQSANLKQEEVIDQLKLSLNYWKARIANPIVLPFKNDRIKIVIHIRRGDTACFSLKGKIISVFADSIKIVDTMDDIHDPSRRPIPTDTFSRILWEVFKKYGEENFSVLILSDGYKRAFDTIESAAKEGKIKINKDELEYIKKEAPSEFNIFKNYSNVSCIIGESRENLFKSIHAIVSADILIMSTGGFALYPHVFFKKERHASICFYGGDSTENITHHIAQIGTTFADRLPVII